MLYGYETYRPDTTIITSTARSGSLVFIELLNLVPGQSGNKLYPGVASNGLTIHKATPAAHELYVDSDINGIPRLNWVALAYTAQTNPTQVAVMANRLASSSNTDGINVANEAGEVFISSDYPSPQFVGYLDLNTAAESNMPIEGGYTMYSHGSIGTTAMAIDATRLVVMGLPDSGAADTWYALEMSMIPPFMDIDIFLSVYAISTNYELPRLFIFSIDNPSQVAFDYGLLVYAPNNRLLYDASADNMALMDKLDVSYPPLGSTVTLTPNIGVATHVGITFPGCAWNVVEGEFNRGGQGVVKKSGGQLTFKRMQHYYQNPPDDEPPPYQGDSTDNLLSLVVDLTYLGFFVSNGSGGGTAQSPPQITSQPSNVSVTSGAIAQFSVTATGNPALYYRWYRNGLLISGATARIYQFTAASSDHGAQFRCLVGNALGTVNSATVTLTVTDTSEFQPVGLAYGPSNTLVTAGETASFSVSAYGTSPILYQWYRNNSPVGPNSNTYFFTASMADHGDTVYCEVSNGNGTYSQTSSTATLSVQAAQPTAPVISVQPSDITANQGQIVHMHCSASPADRYAWYRNGSYDGDGEYFQVDANTIGTFTYYCLVYNGGVTTQSSNATLTVIGPSSSPYSSYNDIDAVIDVMDNDPMFAVYNNGSSDGGNWGLGTGDGTLYTVYATGDFTPTGFFQLNTMYDLAEHGGVNWIGPRPVGSDPGDMITRYMNVTITLKGGGTVSTGAITLISRNSGSIET